MKKRRRRKHGSLIKSLNEVNTQVTKSSNVPIIILVIIFIAGLMIGFVWQKVRINKLVVEIEALRRQEQILKERVEKKRALVLNLSNGSRIKSIAEKQLNMVFPPYEIVALSDNFKTQKKLVENIINNNN